MGFSSSCEYSFQVGVIFLDPWVAGLQFHDLSAGVNDRRVIAATESVADLWQAVIRQFLGQSHRDLAWASDRTIPSLRQQVGNSDLVILRNRFLDVVHRDQPVLQGEQIA